MGDSYLPQTSTVRKARLNLWAPTSKKQVLSSDYAQASFGRKVVPNPKRGASEYLKNLAILLEGAGSSAAGLRGVITLLGGFLAPILTPHEPGYLYQGRCIGGDKGCSYS